MPEGAGWDATEGSGPAVAGGDTFYLQGESNRQGYMERDGVLHVPRRTAGGGSPVVDPKKGLAQFQVNIIDGDSQQSFSPGETDFEGKPLPKGTPCQTSPAPVTPSLGSPPPNPNPQSPSSIPMSGTSTGSAGAPTKPRRRQSQLPTETESLLRSLTEQVLSLQQQQRSPTSAPPPMPLVSSELIQISSEMGEFSFEVLGVELRNEGALVILWEPRKPRFIPKGDTPIVVHWHDKLFRCAGDALSLKVALGGAEVLVVVLPLLETQG